MATDPDAARRYLKDALEEKGVPMKHASEAVGRNHAYIEQYITRGKPRWLPEPIRESLVKLCGLDGERLRPPPAQLRITQRHHEPQVYPPGLGKFVDEPRKIELLDLFEAMDEDRQALAMDIMRNLVSRPRVPA